MTRSLTIAGRVLTASRDERIITGLLLPYGEQGRTSAGKVTAAAGALELPEDPAELVANLEHDPTRPVARGTALEDTDTGLVASFRVARTRAGDDLLEEAAEGLRAGLSVEVDNPVIRGGALVGGRLSGAGFVVQPAFPSAQLVAADTEVHESTEREVTYTEDDGTEVTVETTTETTYTETITTNDDDDLEDDSLEDDPQEDEDPDMGDSTATAARTATVPAGSLAASRAGRGPARTRPTPGRLGKGELFRLLAGAQRDNARALTAALSDIVPGDILGVEQPQYVGELWDGKAYERRIIPLFNHDDLTSFKVAGWRWVTKPAVARYEGNKTEVPSNQVKTEPVDVDAFRIAGAHDIDRKFRDFNDEAFFAAYFAAMTESYARVSDIEVLTEVLAEARPVTRGTVPADVAPGMVSVVDGALSVLEETDTPPTFAVLATDLWRDILLTPKDKTLEYLNSALGLEDGSLDSFRMVPSSALDAGSALVGVKSAVTVHELGGPAPIRVEALDIARGGIDEGVFGYAAVNTHDNGGLALVTAAPAGE